MSTPLENGLNVNNLKQQLELLEFEHEAEHLERFEKMERAVDMQADMVRDIVKSSVDGLVSFAWLNGYRSGVELTVEFTNESEEAMRQWLECHTTPPQTPTNTPKKRKCPDAPKRETKFVRRSARQSAQNLNNVF